MKDIQAKVYAIEDLRNKGIIGEFPIINENAIDKELSKLEIQKSVEEELVRLKASLQGKNN